MAGCHLVYFLREVCHKPKITKAVLAERTEDYQAWVEACARNHQFVSVGDSQALQRAADQLDGQTLQARIDYWALIVGPKFSPGNARRAAACTAAMRACNWNIAAILSSSATGRSVRSSSAPASWGCTY